MTVAPETEDHQFPAEVTKSTADQIEDNIIEEHNKPDRCGMLGDNAFVSDEQGSVCNNPIHWGQGEYDDSSQETIF